MTNRKITDVIHQLLQIIPKKETKLINELNEYQNNNLWNVAPELLSNGIYFIEVGNILNSNICGIDCDWKKELLKVFNNK